jgi:hypothetical protein
VKAALKGKPYAFETIGHILNAITLFWLDRNVALLSCILLEIPLLTGFVHSAGSLPITLGISSPLVFPVPIAA